MPRDTAPETDLFPLGFVESVDRFQALLNYVRAQSNHRSRYRMNNATPYPLVGVKVTSRYNPDGAVVTPTVIFGVVVGGDVYSPEDYSYQNVNLLVIRPYTGQPNWWTFPEGQVYHSDMYLRISDFTFEVIPINTIGATVPLTQRIETPEPAAMNLADWELELLGDDLLDEENPFA